MTTALLPLGVLVAAFAIAWALVPVTGRVARRYGVMDDPGPRKIHQAPTPRIGGVAVYLAFTVVVLAGFFGVPFLAEIPWVRTNLAAPLAMLQEAYRVESKLVGLLGGATIVFVVGLLDDVLGARFKVGWKMAGQVLAAVFLIAGGIRTDFMPRDWLDIAVTLVWVVGITNAFNLLDNMDGLSAGVALVASLVLLLNAWLLGGFFMSLVYVALIGSLLGFLVYNWHPASIFLGDSGSLFIGFVLALPILDTTTVTVIRIRERRPIYVGDSRHLSHRLVSLGMRPPLAVFTIYLISLGLGLGAVGLAHASLTHSVIILVQALTVVVVVLILLFYERRVGPREEAR